MIGGLPNLSTVYVLFVVVFVQAIVDRLPFVITRAHLRGVPCILDHIKRQLISRIKIYAYLFLEASKSNKLGCQFNLDSGEVGRGKEACHCTVRDKMRSDQRCVECW